MRRVVSRSSLRDRVGDLPAPLVGQVADPRASSAIPNMTMTPAGPIPDPRM
ncbi:hypothetical protein [Rhodococcus koreensis]